jgi:hypothetical protein
MVLIRPKLVALVSSTLGLLTRDRLTNADASHIAYCDAEVIINGAVK